MKQPVLRPRPPKKQILMQFYELSLVPFGLNLDIAIQPMFIWDGASIPRALWSLIGSPYHPKFQAASLVHDYLYKYQLCSRKEADKVFYWILRANGVSKDQAKQMYLGVRAGGFIAWNRHKRALKNEGK